MIYLLLNYQLKIICIQLIKKYTHLNKSILPSTESLKNVVDRFLLYGKMIFLKKFNQIRVF